jgi:subtilisin family serine protease
MNKSLKWKEKVNIFHPKFIVTIVLFFLMFLEISMSFSHTLNSETLFVAKELPVISKKFNRFLSQQSPEKQVKVWVFFTDKGIFTQKAYEQALKHTIHSLTPKALKRREKTMGKNTADFLDLPVYQAYTEEVLKYNARLRCKSRWLNAASFKMKVSALQKIADLPFVRFIKPVLAFKRKPALIEEKEQHFVPMRKKTLLDYGPSYDQLLQLNVPAVHDLGYAGEGVLVCIMDTGFRKDHQAFHLAFQEGRVLAEYDFINNDYNTQDEAGDTPGQHDHGTATWSTLGGAYAGQLYGPAYKASFILAKTEDIWSETPIEEDNWVAGMEWADSIGADVISSSLGYIDWYDYSDLDGNTAITSIAADIAAGRGVVVCNAMGNSGPDSGSLIAPADADSILACGAVGIDGSIVLFSSRGPTYDGRIKPEVCARGIFTYCASSADTNSYVQEHGTSLSTPLVGGCAAVLLSAHPDWAPVKIREALTMTASNATTPNNDYGWGIIDLLAAVNYEVESIHGDANQDGVTNIADAVFLVNYLFNNGPAPDPLSIGDMNCIDQISIVDVVYLINYLFKSGPPPGDPDDDGVPDC